MSASSLDHGAHVVDAQPVLRNRPAQQALVGAIPVAQRALEIGQILLRGARPLRLVLDQHIDDAVGRLDVDRADLLRV